MKTQIKRVTFAATMVTAENAIELSQDNGIPVNKTGNRGQRTGAEQAKYLKQQFAKGKLIDNNESPVISEITGKPVRRPNKGSNAEQVLAMIKEAQAKGEVDPDEMAAKVREKFGLKQLGTAKDYVAVSLERAQVGW